MPCRTCALNVDINIDTQSNSPYTSPHQLTPHQNPSTPYSSPTPLPALQQRKFYPGSVSRHLSLSKAFGRVDCDACAALYAYMRSEPFHLNFLRDLLHLDNAVLNTRNVPCTWNKTIFIVSAKLRNAKLPSDFQPITNVHIL